jgi:type II secretory pathway predicted ATPase ExeA
VEHLARFGLERDPFRSESQLEFWFSSRAHVAAGRRLRRCVEQGKELCVLCGPVGSGTTMVLRALFEQLDADRFELGLLIPMRGTGSDELRAMIARQLGVESPAPNRSEGIRQLFAHLVALHGEGRRAVVGIDEAHTLPPDALGELRALLQLEHEDTRLLSIVLAGTPDLAEILSGDTSLPGRIDLQVALEPLDEPEASAYLAHRIEVAGGDPTLFDDAVLGAIAQRCGGLPRRLNALADGALFEAHLAERDRPTREDVERAALDLPWAQPDQAAVTRVALPVDDVLDASLGGAPAIESLRDADSASFADLDLPEPDGDVAREIEQALAPNDDDASSPMLRRFALDSTVRDASFDAELLSEETAPGAWQSATPIDNDTTASRGPRKSAAPPARELPPVPSEDELDDLFVDLVDEVEPEKPR